MPAPLVRPAALPRLYAIVDVEQAERAGWRPADLADRLIAGGARLVQVRAKRLASGPFADLSAQVVAGGAASGARVVVNDRPDIAVMTGAAGVHVGQDDLPVPAARAIVGANAIVGVSTHTASEIEAALGTDADYVAVGPVFETATKAARRVPVGLELVRIAARLAGGRPIVAIGGITLDRAAEVIDAGAASVAVISDLIHADPAGRAAAWLARLGGRRATG